MANSPGVQTANHRLLVAALLILLPPALYSLNPTGHDTYSASTQQTLNSIQSGEVLKMLRDLSNK